jgi:peptidoglycan LD-endopeptidase CwlK
MIAKLGPKSLARLATCQQVLQDFVAALVIQINTEENSLVKDIQVTCGIRGKKEQNDAYKAGYSQLAWPKSKHNNAYSPVPVDPATWEDSAKSSAVDIYPYPTDWHDDEQWLELGRIGKKVIEEKGYPVKWGGDWKKFKDYPHWELK